MSADTPVVYLLPGLLCDEACWAPQQDALSSVAEVRIPSFKGYDSLAGMAASVLAGAPARFSVAGHSMGGRVAWELMMLAPERIDKFCVLDTGIHPVSEGEPLKRQKFLELGRQSMKALADFWIPPMLHPDRVKDKVLYQTIESMVLRYSYAEFEGQIKALLGRRDQAALLPGIAQDVLLICGAQDQWSPVARHEDMKALLPRARLEVVEHCGHMSTLEQPEAVNRLLLDWITG